MPRRKPLKKLQKLPLKHLLKKQPLKLRLKKLPQQKPLPSKRDDILVKKGNNPKSSSVYIDEDFFILIFAHRIIHKLKNSK